MTATLSNPRTRAIHDVAVETRLTARETSIDTAHRHIGTLGAGDSVTLTTRITIGVRDAFAIKATNGRVTITTIITSNTGRRVITVRRDVT